MYPYAFFVGGVNVFAYVYAMYRVVYAGRFVMGFSTIRRSNFGLVFHM